MFSFKFKKLDLFEDLPEPSTDSKETSQSSSNCIALDKLPAPANCNQDDSTGVPVANLKRKCSEETDCNFGKKTLSGVYTLKGYLAERKGERDEMQDAHLIIDNFHNNVQDLDSSMKRLAVYAVFDGHGGARASRFAAKYLPVNLASTFPNGDATQIEKDIKRYLIDIFKRTDEEFLKEATRTKPSWKDGTTAVVILAINDILYISNLGDSKAILCRYSEETKRYNSLSLSKDHSPTDYEERMRIQKAGGQVRDGRVMGILEVSRSIGDGQFKNCGVISIPDVRRCQLLENDHFIVLACDGLWKVFTSDEVIKIVLKVLEDETLTATDYKSVEEVRYETACSRLANEAVRKLSGDNVTVIIVAVNSRLDRTELRR